MVCVSGFCRATHLHSVPAEGGNLCRIFCDSLEVRRQQIQLCFLHVISLRDASSFRTPGGLIATSISADRRYI